MKMRKYFFDKLALLTSTLLNTGISAADINHKAFHTAVYKL